MDCGILGAHGHARSEIDVALQLQTRIQCPAPERFQVGAGTAGAAEQFQCRWLADGNRHREALPDFSRGIQDPQLIIHPTGRTGDVGQCGVSGGVDGFGIDQGSGRVAQFNTRTGNAGNTQSQLPTVADHNGFRHPEIHQADRRCAGQNPDAMVRHRLPITRRQAVTDNQQASDIRRPT